MDRDVQERELVLLAADELAGLLETAHLLHSPANAERLLTALGRAREQDLPAIALGAP